MTAITSLKPAEPQPQYAPLPAPLAGRGIDIDALYLHVPFCATKCHYCDFYSLAGHMDRADAYLAALAREILAHVTFFGRPRPRTIFIGGGTPTLLSPDQLQTLLQLIRNAIDTSQLTEFTMEANPNTFDAAKAAVLVGGRVNRISFGAQSFNLDELRMLQRDHDPESVPTAFATARAAGLNNLNVDLIFGIPGQTRQSWAHSLDRTLALAPDHMSCYSLTYEPNTAMTARLRAGDFHKIDEDTELALFEDVYHRLHAAGFTRYETSNYARSKPCLHNLAYWKAGNWLGWGPSAGSHFAAKADSDTAAWQWKNAGSLAHYLDAFSGTAPSRLPLVQMEALPRHKWSAAAAVFWLRLNEGLNFAEFTARTGINARPTLERVLSPFAQQGFAELLPDQARITEKGVAVSNHILSRVLAALEK